MLILCMCVSLRCPCVCGRCKVSFRILRTLPIRARALWILISHFAISRYPRTAGLCAGMWGECLSECDQRFSRTFDIVLIGGENRETRLRRMWLAEAQAPPSTRVTDLSAKENQSYSFRSGFKEKKNIRKAHANAWNRCEWNSRLVCVQIFNGRHFSSIVCGLLSSVTW